MTVDLQWLRTELDDGEKAVGNASLLQNFQPSFDVIVRAATRVVDANGIVNLLGAVHANTDQHPVFKEYLSPSGIQECAICLNPEIHCRETIEDLPRSGTPIIKLFRFDQAWF